MNSGDFSFAGGKLRYDSLSNVLEVSGRITATSGSIGGFTIGSSSIYNGTSSLTSTTTGIYLGTNGIRQYASSDAYTNITKGILTAKGANITGTISTDNITATGGTIGKWSIGKPNKSYGLNECLYTETESGIIGLQSSKYANNVAFFVKDKEGNDITYIKNNGELCTSNILITGGNINVEAASSTDAVITLSKSDSYVTKLSPDGLSIDAEGMSIGGNLRLSARELSLRGAPSNPAKITVYEDSEHQVIADAFYGIRATSVSTLSGISLDTRLGLGSSGVIESTKSLSVAKGDVVIVSLYGSGGGIYILYIYDESYFMMSGSYNSGSILSSYTPSSSLGTYFLFLMEY